MAYDPLRDEEQYSPLTPVPYNPTTGAYTIDNRSPLQPATPTPIEPSQSAIQPQQTAAPLPSSIVTIGQSSPLGFAPSQPAIQQPPPEADAGGLTRAGVVRSLLDNATKPAPKPEEGFFGKLGTAFGAGVDTMQESLKATGNAYLGDNRAIEANAANLGQIQQAKPEEQRQFMQAVDALPDGFNLDTIKGMAGAVWDNPQGALQEVVAQAPNSAPVLASMATGAIAGAKLGAMLGPYGAAIGGAAGTLIGAIAGNLGIETGAKVMDYAQDGLKDAERQQGIKEGAIKSAFIGGVDTATLGVSRWLMGAPGRAASKAIADTLTKSGVNMADDAAVQVAMKTMGVGSEAMLNGAKAFAVSAGRAPRRVLAAAGLETVMEGVGEYGGEELATGEGSFKEALLESIMSAPMSAAEIVWAKSEQGELTGLGPALNRATGVDLRDQEAIDRYIATNVPQFAALSLDADRMNGLTKDQVMQSLGNAQAPMDQRINAVSAIAADMAIRQKLPQVSKAWLDQAKKAMESGQAIRVPGYTQPLQDYKKQQEANLKLEKYKVWNRDAASYPLTPPEERESIIRGTESAYQDQQAANQAAQAMGPFAPGQGGYRPQTGPVLPDNERRKIDQWINRPGRIDNRMEADQRTGMVGGKPVEPQYASLSTLGLYAPDAGLQDEGQAEGAPDLSRLGQQSASRLNPYLNEMALGDANRRKYEQEVLQRGRSAIQRLNDLAIARQNRRAGQAVTEAARRMDAEEQAALNEVQQAIAATKSPELENALQRALRGALNQEPTTPEPPTSPLGPTSGPTGPLEPPQGPRTPVQPPVTPTATDDTRQADKGATSFVPTHIDSLQKPLQATDRPGIYIDEAGDEVEDNAADPITPDELNAYLARRQQETTNAGTLREIAGPVLGQGQGGQPGLQQGAIQGGGNRELATQEGRQGTDATQGQVAPQDATSPEAAQKRNQDRIARIATLTTEEDMQAVLREEESDPQRSFDGWDEVKNAITKRRQQIKNEARAADTQRRYEAGEWLAAPNTRYSYTLSEAEETAKALQAQDPDHEYRATIGPNDDWVVDRRKKPETNVAVTEATPITDGAKKSITGILTPEQEKAVIEKWRAKPPTVNPAGYVKKLFDLDIETEQRLKASGGIDALKAAARGETPAVVNQELTTGTGNIQDRLAANRAATEAQAAERAARIIPRTEDMQIDLPQGKGNFLLATPTEDGRYVGESWKRNDQMKTIPAGKVLIDMRTTEPAAATTNAAPDQPPTTPDNWDSIKYNLTGWYRNGQPRKFGLNAENAAQWDALTPEQQAEIKQAADNETAQEQARLAQGREETARREAMEASAKDRLLRDEKLTNDEVEQLGLRVRGSEFKYLSPIVQKLFGIPKMQVRKAMGDALQKGTTDMGAEFWSANPHKALANAAAYAREKGFAQATANPPAMPDSAPTTTKQGPGGYQLPTGSVTDDWLDEKGVPPSNPSYQPNERQQRLFPAIKQALDEGLFYNREVEKRVAEILGVSADVLKRNESNVDGGDFGLDVYNARKIVERERQRQTQGKIRQDLNLKPGENLGTLVINGKQTTNLTVEAVNDNGEVVMTGKQGARTLRTSIDLASLPVLFDRTQQDGKRKDNYQSFLSGRQPAKPASPSEIPNNSPTGNATEIITPDGGKHAAKWEVVEADSITASLKEGVNQPRDRSRAASDVQIQTIANNPDFARLSDTSKGMELGAPTLAPDGAIVGGNGRFEGVSRAYEGNTAQGYREALAAKAQALGLDPAALTGMKKPILVRRLQGDVDVRKLAIQSNQATGLEMSDMERAALDAERMTGLDKLNFTDTGDIPPTITNLETIRTALKDYSPNEVAGLMTADGALSSAGLRRVRNAILYKAYGKNETLARLLENPDPDLKNVGSALVRAGGPLARLRDEIQAGRVKADYDLSDNLTRAIETLSQLRAEGVSLDTHLRQQDLFGDGLTEAEKTIIGFLDTSLRSAKAISDFLKDYAQIALDTAKAANDMFGGADLPNKTQVLSDVAKRYQNPAKSHGDLFGNQGPDRQATRQPGTGGPAAEDNRPAEGAGEGGQVAPKADKGIDAVPQVVIDSLKGALTRLGDIRKSLDMTIENLDRRFSADGRYEADALRNSDKDIKRNMAVIDEFRRYAPGNGVDAEAVLKELGGVSDFTPSTQAKNWLDYYAEKSAKADKTPAPKTEDQPAASVKSPSHYRVRLDTPFGRFDVYVQAAKDAAPEDYIKDAKTAFISDLGAAANTLSSRAQIKAVGEPEAVVSAPQEASKARNADWASIAKAESQPAPKVEDQPAAPAQTAVTKIAPNDMAAVAEAENALTLKDKAAIAAKADPEVLRAYAGQRKAYLDQFTGRERKQYEKFVTAAETKFMAGRVRQFVPGMGVEVDNGDGTVTRHLYSANTGNFIPVEKKPFVSPSPAEAKPTETAKPVTRMTRDEYFQSLQANKERAYRNRDVARLDQDLSILRDLFADEIAADKTQNGIRRQVEDANEGVLRLLDKTDLAGRDLSTFRYAERKIAELYDRAEQAGKTLPDMVVQERKTAADLAALRQKLEQAQSRLDKAQSAYDALNAQSAEVPGSFATGRSNQSASLTRQREALNNRLEDAFRELQAAQAEVDRLQERLRGVESGERYANGQQRADAPSRQQAASTAERWADYIRARVKKGDRVTFTPNPNKMGRTVVRLNAKTVTLDGGTTWEYSNILPWKDGQPMTAAEAMADFKAWMAETNAPDNQVRFSKSPAQSKAVTAEQDRQYLDAVARGDMETAQLMVDQAARNAGYMTNDEYRMQHRAPNRENDVSLTDVQDADLVPADYWTKPEWYQSPEEMDSFYAVKNALQRNENRKAAGRSPGGVRITVYRAVPKDVKDGSIRNGDWVTPSRSYAQQEGEMIPGGYRIIEQTTLLRNVFWDGNSIAELGFDDGKPYAYRNTKNNRKLLDAVTYDDNDRVIPLSKRFNYRNEDVRYQTGQAAAPASPTAVRQAVSRIMRNWANAPRAEIFTGIDELPPAVRAEYDRQTAKLLAENPDATPDQVNGFWFQGKIWINTEAVPDFASLEATVRHEGLGHHGLRMLFGSELNDILDRVIASQRPLVEAKAQAYKLDMAKVNDARIAAEELLAEWAQTRPTMGIVRQLVAFIRAKLRAWGLKSDLTRDEILREYVIPARGFVERGNPKAEGMLDSLVPAFMFGGRSALTADRHALSRAQYQIDAGVDPETVRQITGWHQGKDGKWRFEIDDSQARFAENIFSDDGDGKISAAGYLFDGERPLSEAMRKRLGRDTYFATGLLNHPQLLAAYPGLADYRVEIKINPERKGYSGSWRKDNVWGFKIELSAANQEDALSSLLHELQHGIQFIEDFASGSNYNLARQRPEYQQAMAEYRRDKQGATSGWESVDTTSDDETVNEILIADRVYRRTLGEAEARLTQARQNLTAEQRRTTPLMFDVPDEDIIVTFNGKDAANAPRPANAGMTAAEANAAQGAGDIRFSLSGSQTQSLDSKWTKLGMAPERAKTLTEHVRDLLGINWREAGRGFLNRGYEGLFDGLINIDRAEQEVGIRDFAQRGYISARLATGVSDVVWGLLMKGAPEWRQGVLSYKQGTKGLLTILGDLGPDMRDWLGWMAGNRARELLAQGKENNLDPTEIAELIALATPDKAAKFLQAKADYNALNKAMLDVAEQAGLIDPASRAQWASDWYVPFYRQREVDGDLTLLGPRTSRGLSHQSAGIRALKGGEAPTNDLLENVLTNWVKLTDASMKNHALAQVTDNLSGTRFMQDETTKFKQVFVSKTELIQRLKEDPDLVAAVADWLGVSDGDVEYTLNEVKKLARREVENLYAAVWTKVAPEGKDIIRVQRNGKNHYYKVLDPSLLRSINSFGFTGFNDPVTSAARKFKRLLTTGVTSMPDFIIRNFVRDAVQAWAINPDGMRFASSAIKGLREAYGESDAYWDLVFSGAAFQGGYVHGSDPEASAQMVRRALGKKGLSPSQISQHEKGVLTSARQVWDVLDKYWQKYRGWGDKAENVNRLATYQAAIAAGKHPLQAAYEAKDFMDYSLRGNYTALLWLTDVVPFLNARIQGLGKLGRAMKADPRAVGIKFAKIAAFSVALAALNGDDERYKELPEWKKDAYWHFWLGDEHFMVPKPFEVGVLAGTLPERMFHTFITGTQENDKFLWSLKHNIMGTFGFNPIPQVVLPIFETYANRSMYFDTPIENLADQGQLPENRYDSRTSDTMRVLGSWLGTSPKKLEHLYTGYLGTLGMYTLGVSDAVVRWAGNAPERPTLPVSAWPIVRSFYGGDVPARSTSYQQELYDAFKEVEMIHRTINDMRKEGRTEQAKELQTEEAPKLRYRGQINAAKRRLDEIRRQMERISMSSMTGDMKRTRLDRLTAERNRLTRQVAERIAPAF